MLDLIKQDPPVFVPLFFVTMWLMITTILSVLSGWFWLMVRFPNQESEPILRLRRQSGSMGLGVVMNGILTLSVCPAGLRVGMMRPFGPFCRDFLVPWQDLTVTRRKYPFWSVAKLRFGKPAIGSLRIEPHIANRLARAAPGQWPETGPFPEEQSGTRLRRLLLQWGLMTLIAALFFTLTPLTAAPQAPHPPLLVAILFPAIVFGFGTIVRYFRERG